MSKIIKIGVNLDTTNAVKGLTDLEQKLTKTVQVGESFAKIGGAIGAAFSVATGVVGAFGDTLGYSSEEIENAQKKATSYMAIIQGIKPIFEGIQSAVSIGIKIFANFSTILGTAQKAFAVLNAVMIANPIGLIITAIGALIALIVIFYEEIQQAIDWVRNLDTEFQILIGVLGGPLIGAILAVNWALEELGIIGKGTNEELMRGFNNTIKEVVRLNEEEKKLKAERKETFDITMKSLENEKTAVTERYDWEIKKMSAVGANTSTTRKQMLAELINIAKEEIRVLRERYGEEENLFGKIGNYKKIKQLKGEIKASEEEITLIDLSEGAKRAAAAESNAAARKNLLRQIEDLEIELIENEKKREEMRAFSVYKRRIEDLEGSEQEKIRLTELYGEQLRQTLNKINGDIILDTEENSEEIADIMITGITPPESEFVKVEEEYKNFFQRVKAMAQENSEASKEFIKKETEAWTAAQMQKIDTFEMYSNAVTSIGSSILEISDNFRKKDEKEDLKSKKRKFEFDKIANITTAGIEGAKGIVKAVAASPTTFGLPFSAFVGATTLAQITAIASKRFDGGGSGASSNGSVGSVSSAPVPSQTTLFGTSGLPGGDSELNRGSELGIRQKPSMVYVSANEVATEQELLVKWGEMRKW